jgi:protein-tyrosine phosphatase
MIDIHCHILPKLDDGPETMEMSLQMAEMAIEEGVTHLIGTPHSNSRWTFNLEANKRLRDELQSHFGGRLTIGTGCDFHLSFENLQAIREDRTRFTLNQRNYLLVEFADFSIPPALDQALHELQLEGITPIVTHPERNPLIRTNPDRLFKWLQQGCYAQVTAQSVMGKFGRSAQEAAQKWLAAGAFHFIASDAHNVSSRPLRLRDTYAHVSQVYGEEMARALMVDNPLAAFEGRPLPYVPNLETDDSADAWKPRKKKRFFFF